MQGDRRPTGFELRRGVVIEDDRRRERGSDRHSSGAEAGEKKLDGEREACRGEVGQDELRKKFGPYPTSPQVLGWSRCS